MLEQRLERLRELQPRRVPSAARAEAIVGDSSALAKLSEAVAGMTADMANVLSRCAELTEAQHDMWKQTPEQLALTEQMRSVRRLAHRLKLAVEGHAD